MWCKNVAQRVHDAGFGIGWCIRCTPFPRLIYLEPRHDRELPGTLLLGPTGLPCDGPRQLPAIVQVYLRNTSMLS